MNTSKKSSSSKAQPKISNFLVPSTPFSNKSPSKQLKISSFFKRADSRDSQEENICNNVSSPDCIPPSPDQSNQEHKRKRNDGTLLCRRKLQKLENYNKILYDEKSNNDCQLVEATRSSETDTSTKLKSSSNSNAKEGTKNIIVFLKADKTLSKAPESNAHNRSVENVSESDILLHKSKIQGRKETIGMPSCAAKDKTEKGRDPVKISNTPSVLGNDDLLSELLGEIDVPVTQPSEDSKLMKHKSNNAAAYSCETLVGSKSIKLSGSLEFLMNIESDGVKTKPQKDSITRLDQKLKMKLSNTPMREKSLTSKPMKQDEMVKNICEKELDPMSKVESIESSNISFLKINGVQAPKTPEKKSNNEILLDIPSTPDRNLDLLKIPLTPEKTEASSIFQEVAAVLSNTKSPHVTPAKSVHAELSEISKINFDDEMEYDWNFSQLDLLEQFDLSQWTKCEVMKVDFINGTSLQLQLKSCELPSSILTCLIQGSWVHIQLQVGDIINIKAEFSNGGWVVDNTRGLIAFQPDVLVSGTTVVGALFCMRKSILADLFKGVDAGSSIMVLGILLHQFLQEVLRNKLRTEPELNQVINSMLKSQDTVMMLYSSLMSLEDTRKELLSFVPRILKFLNTYVEAKVPPGKSDWPGQILSVQDIEENIWLPNLGIKGKVDVTVKVRSRNIVKTLPLELKTGRASRSAEHRGQVILYAMMMSEMNPEPVDSGLLLYIRENVLDEVRSGHPEKRDLLILRNQLVFYLSQGVRGVDSPYLPPPINHHSACTKCPYLYLCSAALKEEGMDSISDDNPLKKLSAQATSHLTEEHIRFVFQMTALIRMEFEAARHKSKQVSDVWTLNPEAREARGDCIANLSLEPCVQSVKCRYICSLSRPYAIPSLLFSLSQYVIVSSSTQPAVASGFITAIQECGLSLSIDRDLTVLSETGVKFHVDTYESQSLMSFNLIGLGLLLEPEHRISSSLRSLIIDKAPPRFSRKHHASILDTGRDLFSRLNVCQKKAVLKALTAKDYLLIKGMPGTGKSSTLVCLIELLVRLNLSVLVTSHTHSAVDNLLLRLIDKVPFLRLGSVSRIHPSILPYCDAVCTKHSTSPEQLAKFYATKPVIGVTCMGSVHPLLQKRTFDVCIVDEASQVLLPAVLPPLMAAQKFILVGDPDQLCPLVLSKEASKLGLSESLFCRLDRPEVTTYLTAQYRMNGPITQLVNRFTYQGKLECADDCVKLGTIPDLSFHSNESWLQKCLCPQLESSVVFLNVSCEESEETTNLNEANIVRTLVSSFLQGGISAQDIGVMGTYRNQVSLLKQLIRNEDVETNTVDQYQGRDKSIILYSTTCISRNKESKILNDRKRLTVAISRSKHKLIILGDILVISKSHPVLNELLEYVRECGSVIDELQGGS